MGEIKIRHVFLLFFVALLMAFFVNALQIRHNREIIYNSAIDDITDGRYQDAVNSLDSINEFKDAQKQILYSQAMLLFADGEYKKAEDMFSQLGDFRDSSNYMQQCEELQKEAAAKQRKNQAQYNAAKGAFRKKNYVEARSAFIELGDFKDSQEMALTCKALIRMRSYAHTLSAGIRYSAAVSNDGTAYFSGEGFSGEADLETWTDIVSISAKGHIVIGLKSDGTVVTAGKVENYRIDTSMWRDIVAVEAGQQYIVGLREDGTLTAQGHNGDGQTNIDGDEWTDIVSIACGWRHTVGLDSNGNIHITGYRSDSQLKQIKDNQSEWTDIVAISAGGGSNEYGKRGHTVGLKRDGTAVAVGDNDHGQCNVTGEDWTNLVAISAGDDHTVGLRADGTVVTTQTPKKPSDAGAAIPDWTNVAAISAGYGFTLALVKDAAEDGQLQYVVVGDGNYRNGQRNTDSWLSVATYKDEWDLLFNENFISDYFTDLGPV